jgi:hypothetical protein
MKFFPGNPEKAAAKEAGAALANRDRLAGKLVEAEQAVISAKSTAQAAALAGDDAALDIAEAAEAAALRRLSTIFEASAVADKVLVDIEAKIAANADQKQRTATAAEVTALADELIEAAAAYDASTAALNEVCARAKIVTIEFEGMVNFTTSSRTEVSVAVPILEGLLRDYGTAVVGHTAPAAMPVAEPLFVPDVVVKPETRHLFTLRGISWKEGDMMRSAKKYTDVDLPVAIAARALRTNACCEMDSPMRNPSTVNMWPNLPALENCFNLDDDEPKTKEQLPAGFERIDRGAPYLVRTAAGGAS